MSYRVEFAKRKGVSRDWFKTKVVDLHDDDGSPVYLMTPGQDGSELRAREKWARFRLWVADEFTRENPEMVRASLPPLEVDKQAGVKVRGLVLTAVALIGAGIGYAAATLMAYGWPW